jgi:hypothetical protein
MIGERTNEGWQLRLRSRGVGRYVGASFLAFWLCGWVAGEAFALWILIVGAIALLTGRPPEPGREPLDPGPAVMTGAFLLIWLTIWTFGGIAAIAELLRLLWGDDRITVSSGRLTVSWARGPFRRTREFERDAIRKISLVGRHDHLALETDRGSVELSRLGSRSERAEGAAALRAELAIAEAASATAVALPQGWEEVITPEGERVLVTNRSTRRAQARFASVVAIAVAGLTMFLARESIRRWDLMIPAFILLVFTAGLAAGAVWLARGRYEWRIGSGGLTLRKRFGSNVKDVFEARRLVIDSSTDSDGDPWYELEAIGDGEQAPAPTAPRWSASKPNTRSIARVMDEAASIHQLAAWLSRETGLSLEDRTTPQAREQQLAELKVTLQSSGRLGQWALKLVERLGEREKKAG